MSVDPRRPRVPSQITGSLSTKFDRDTRTAKHASCQPARTGDWLRQRIGAAVALVALAATCTDPDRFTRIRAAVAGILIMWASTLALADLSPFQISAAKAVSRTVLIDHPATDQDLEFLSGYLEVDAIRNLKINTTIFGDLRIFRIESQNYCVGRKCLTVVVTICGNSNCPFVSILAEDIVYNNDVYINHLGGVISYTFGKPGEPGVSVLVGKKLLVVTTTP